MEEDDEFLQACQAFGPGISNEGQEMILRLRNNQPTNNNEFLLEDIIQPYLVIRFTDQAWKLLGRYIANNTHLKKVNLDGRILNDESMSLLFGELVKSSSIEELDIGVNELYTASYHDFGIEGVRSMIPFLKNSPQLKTLHLGKNNKFNSECFEVLVSVLHGRNITDLGVPYCNINDISTLARYNPPNLQNLDLNCNNIGRDGIRTLSNLLQNEGSNLTRLTLQNTGIGDEEAEMIASSLKHNTKLEELHLEHNNLKGNGSNVYVAFLKILVDISSVGNTYGSNHTLRKIRLNIGDDTVTRIANFPNWNKPLAWINKICNENTISNLHAAGKAKIMRYQLDREDRELFCTIQGVEYPTNIFADVDDPLLLPKVLDIMTVERDPDRIRFHARYQREGPVIEGDVAVVG